MPLQEHVETLRIKHARLEELIEDELHRPLPDQCTLSTLKKQKLRIKEEIERTRNGHGANHALAAATPLN